MDLKDYQKSPLRRNILQFFGGQSNWKDFPFEKYFTSEYTDLDFLYDLKQILYSLRNESFHFDTRNHNMGSWNQPLIIAMFEYDCKQCSVLQKSKFYSNNLPMFYGQKDLEKILKRLYEVQAGRASQVPSFNSVFVRKNFKDFIRNNLGWNINFTGEKSLENLEKFESGLYYLLKEIYYNLFLQGKGLSGDFDVKGQFKKWSVKDFRFFI